MIFSQTCIDLANAILAGENCSEQLHDALIDCGIDTDSIVPCSISTWRDHLVGGEWRPRCSLMYMRGSTAMCGCTAIRVILGLIN